MSTTSGRIREFIRSNIMGILALYVALGGTAYATHPGGANTISTGDIINGQVGTVDIGNGRIFNNDIAEDAIQSGRIKDNTVTGVDVDEATLAVPDGSLSANVARLNAVSQTFTGATNFDGNVDVDLLRTGGGGGDFFVQTSTSPEPFSFAPQFSVQFENNTTGGFQGAGRFENAGTSAGETEYLLELLNSDSDTAVGQGLKVAGSTVTTALDVSDADIVNALSIGANDIVTSGATISSTELNALDDGISADDIGNVTRNVNLPVGSFLNVTDTEAIDFDSAAGDDDPDFALVNGHATLAYDDGGGAVTDDDEVGASFTIPQDYAGNGNGVFFLRVTQGGATATNLEAIECDVSVNGGPAGAPDDDVLANQTASQTAPVIPQAIYSAGASVSVNCRQSNPAADDGVRIHGIDFHYTAAQ